MGRLLKGKTLTMKTFTNEFHSERAAQAAVDHAVATGRADSGHVSGPNTGTGGCLVFRAHVRQGSLGFCLTRAENPRGWAVAETSTEA